MHGTLLGMQCAPDNTNFLQHSRASFYRCFEPQRLRIGIIPRFMAGAHSSVVAFLCGQDRALRLLAGGRFSGSQYLGRDLSGRCGTTTFNKTASFIGPNVCGLDPAEGPDGNHARGN